MSKRMNWDRARYVGMATEEAMSKEDEGLVSVRCRKCGRVGKVRRWLAQNRRLHCRDCGWRGADPSKD